MTDVVGALRTYLKASDVSVITTDIFGGTLPRSFTEGNSHPTCVVLRRSGGGGMGRVNNFGDKRIDIDCYGATEKEASELWDAVYGALKGMGTRVVDNVLFHWAACVADGTSGHDPQTTWPVCIGTFQVLVAEVAAS